MAVQGRVVTKLPARLIGTGNISVAYANGIYTISSSGGSGNTLQINVQGGTTYTLVPEDNGKLIVFTSGSPITVTVPIGLGLGFNCIIAQVGLGPVTVAGDGATVNALNNVRTLPGQYSKADLYAYEPNAFLLAISGVTAAVVVHSRTTSFAGAGLMATTPPLDAGLTTSAGIFDSTGMLVRTLWNTEVGHEHRNNPAAAWDGTLEDGTVAPTGVYTAKVLAHNCTYTWEGVIGNTSPDHSNLNYWNDACPSVDMEIAADGKMWYTSQYGERLPTFGFSTTANIQETQYGVAPTFRASYERSLQITTDGTITYISNLEGTQTLVFGVNCTTNTIVSFDSGADWGGFTKASIASETSATSSISSIAVQRSAGTYLFVSRVAANKLLTLNKTTGATLQTNTTFTEPTLVEVNPNNNDLWMCHKVAGVYRITKCAVDGSGNVTLTATQTSATITTPRSMSISPDGATLLLADAGTHQIKAFNTSDASVKTTFGTSGAFGVSGGYSTSPDVTNTKFMFNNFGTMGGGAGWVAYAPDGSFWVGDSGNYRHLHFSSALSPAYIEQVMYMPAFYACSVCMNDPTRVFVGWLEFAIDYDLPLAIGNGSWTLTKNWAGNGIAATEGDIYNRIKYPGVYSNGRAYAAVSVGGASRNWCELTSTGLRDTGVGVDFNSYIDADMNAYYTNWRGHGTWSSISKNPMTGFDGSDNPQYTYPTDWSLGGDPYLITVDPLPTSFPFIGQWDGNSSWNHVEPTQNGIIPFYDPWGPRGDGAFGINHFGGLDAVTGAVKFNGYPTHANRDSVDQRFLLYPEVPFFAGNSLHAGGQFLYEPGEPHIFICHCGEGQWGNNQVNIWMHYHDSGLVMKQFGVPAPYFASSTLRFPDAFGDNVPNVTTSFKALDQMAGNTRWGGHAFVNGKMYLYQNDEWYHGGLHRWCVDGLNTVDIRTSTISWNSGSYVAPAADPNNLLEGLLYGNTNLPNNTAGWTREPTTNLTSGGYAYVATNKIRCDPRRDRDISLQFSLFSTTACHLSRSIPRVGVDDWSIDAKLYMGISFDQVFGMAFEILDNTNKVILKINNWHDIGLGQLGCKVNGTNLTTPSTNEYQWRYTIEQEVPLLISADVGAATMSITYCGITVSRGVHEVGANMGSPAKVRLVYNQPPAGDLFGDACITRLRYSEP